VVIIGLVTDPTTCRAYILPVFLYGAETIEKRIDAFDQWCLRHILNITWSEHVTNFEVRIGSTGQPLLSDTYVRPDAPTICPSVCLSVCRVPRHNLRTEMPIGSPNLAVWKLITRMTRVTSLFRGQKVKGHQAD